MNDAPNVSGVLIVYIHFHDFVHTLRAIAWWSMAPGSAVRGLAECEYNLVSR